MHTMHAVAGAYSEERKSSAREAHLTGALGHGRFDAGVKMTDKRREWRSLVVCSWEIMHRLSREPHESRWIMLSRNVKDLSGSQNAMSNRSKSNLPGTTTLRS